MLCTWFQVRNLVFASSVAGYHVQSSVMREAESELGRRRFPSFLSSVDTRKAISKITEDSDSPKPRLENLMAVWNVRTSSALACKDCVFCVGPRGGVGRHEEQKLLCHANMGVEDSGFLRAVEPKWAQQWRWLTCVRRRAEINKVLSLCSQPSLRIRNV